MRRHIGLGNQPNILVQMVNKRAHQLDDFMGLGQMQTICAGLFPQKADRIEAEHAHPFINIKAQ